MIRLFHIEYFGIMRDIVRSIAERMKEIELVGQTAPDLDIDLSLQLAQPDIVLLGTNKNVIPQNEFINIADLCSYIHKYCPKTKIIVHCSPDEVQKTVEFFNAGAAAVVSKMMGYDELLKAIRTVKTGQRFISDELSHFFKNTIDYLAGFADRLIEKKSLFSVRELQVLFLISIGSTTREIADKLFISQKTVETHRKNLVHKSHVKNTAELISFSFAHGLL